VWGLDHTAKSTCGDDPCDHRPQASAWRLHRPSRLRLGGAHLDGRFGSWLCENQGLSRATVFNARNLCAKTPRFLSLVPGEQALTLVEWSGRAPISARSGVR
jgi:hypothetical protein